MHQNLEVDFLEKMANFDSLCRKNTASSQMWSFGQGHFGHFQLGNAVICSLYININIYIIVAVLTASVFDFDQMTNDQMTASKKYFFLKYSRTAMKDSYLCSVKLK